MSNVPEHMPDVENSTEPSSRIADGRGPTVFDSLGRLRNLTADASVASLDEAVEKLLQSVERLRSLQDSLRSVATIKRRLTDMKIQRTLEISKQPVRNAPPDNLIPFAGPTKRSDAREIVQAGTFCLQSTVTEAVPPQKPPIAVAATAVASAIPNSDPPMIFSASPVSANPPELRATEIASTGQMNTAATQVPDLAVQRDAPIPSERALADTEIRQLVKSYGQVDKYATDHDRGTLRKASLGGSVLLVFLAASYFFFSSRQPGETAASVDHPQEFTALAAREAVILPASTNSNQSEYLGNLSHAISPAAQPQSRSQDHSLEVMVLPNSIEGNAAKFSENPSQLIVPVAQQPTEPQDRPDKLTP
jgi:hypothetical protein